MLPKISEANTTRFPETAAGETSSASNSWPYADQALEAQKNNLLAYVYSNRETLGIALQDAFGKKSSESQINQLKLEILQGNAPWPAHISLVNAGEIGDNAMGAYSANNGGTIYLDSRVIADPDLLKTVLTEEWGHHLDVVLGGTDSIGDEGEIFVSTLLAGRLSSRHLATLRSENDHGNISIDGRDIPVEFRAQNPFGDVAAANMALEGGMGSFLNESSSLRAADQANKVKAATNIAYEGGMSSFLNESQTRSAADKTEQQKTETKVALDEGGMASFINESEDSRTSTSNSPTDEDQVRWVHYNFEKQTDGKYWNHENAEALFYQILDDLDVPNPDAVAATHLIFGAVTYGDYWDYIDGPSDLKFHEAAKRVNDDLWLPGTDWYEGCHATKDVAKETYGGEGYESACSPEDRLWMGDMLLDVATVGGNTAARQALERLVIKRAASRIVPEEVSRLTSVVTTEFKQRVDSLITKHSPEFGADFSMQLKKDVVEEFDERVARELTSGQSRELAEEAALDHVDKYLANYIPTKDLVDQVEEGIMTEFVKDFRNDFVNAHGTGYTD